LLIVKLHSCYAQESGVGNFGKAGIGVGVGHFFSDSATLANT